MSQHVPHWGEDPYWIEALESFNQLRQQGARHLTLDLDVICAEIFNGGSVAYRLVDAMGSVAEHEGMDGHRGAPRLLLATLARLKELPTASPEG